MKNKICMICKLTIEIPGHEHVKVHHQDIKDVNLSKGYYHIECFRNRLNGTDKVNELQKETMGLLKGVKKMIGIKDEDKIVEIK